jgi:hypothetical protein
LPLFNLVSPIGCSASVQAFGSLIAFVLMAAEFVDELPPIANKLIHEPASMMDCGLYQAEIAVKTAIGRINQQQKQVRDMPLLDATEHKKYLDFEHFGYEAKFGFISVAIIVSSG